MPTQAPQNSAFYFQQAQNSLGNQQNPNQNAVKALMTKVSPKNVNPQQQQVEMQNQQKYSPIRKEIGMKPA